MTKEKLRQVLFLLNEEELEFQKSPTNTIEFYNIERNRIPLVPSEMVSEEVFSLSKQQRFIEIGPHFHDFIEIQYVYEGEFTEYVSDREIHLYCGDICILDAGTVHSISAGGENDIFINILLRKEYYSARLLDRLSAGSVISEFLIHSIADASEKNHHLLFRTEDSPQVRYFFESLMCEYYDKKLNSFDAMECYLLLLLTEVLRTAQYSFSEPDKQEKDSEILYILRYLEHNYKSCTLAALARRFGFHPNYLSSLIHKETGYTFKELVHMQRLKQASLMLKNTGLAVQEIAEAVGYSNLTSFYQKFRAYYDVSPQAYREKNKKS